MEGRHFGGAVPCGGKAFRPGNAQSDRAACAGLSALGETVSFVGDREGGSGHRAGWTDQSDESDGRECIAGGRGAGSAEEMEIGPGERERDQSGGFSFKPESRQKGDSKFLSILRTAGVANQPGRFALG